MAVASDHHAARLVFTSASVLIADSVLRIAMCWSSSGLAHIDIQEPVIGRQAVRSPATAGKVATGM